MQITRTSMLTQKTRTMDLPITDEQIAAYEAGALVQVAFPNLDDDEREFFISGITPDEWDRAFPDEDDIEFSDEDEPAF